MAIKFCIAKITSVLFGSLPKKPSIFVASPAIRIAGKRQDCAENAMRKRVRSETLRHLVVRTREDGRELNIGMSHAYYAQGTHHTLTSSPWDDSMAIKFCIAKITSVLFGSLPKKPSIFVASPAIRIAGKRQDCAENAMRKRARSETL